MQLTASPSIPCSMIYEVKQCFDTALRPIDCREPNACRSAALDLPYGGPTPKVCKAYVDGVPDAANPSAHGAGGDGDGGAASGAHAGRGVAALLLAAAAAVATAALA